MPKAKAILPDPPAKTIEAREKQIIALAVDEAEKRIRNGTASSQLLSHYLRLGTVKAQKELELLEIEKDLKRAKIEAYETAKHQEEMMQEAITAFKSYSGFEDEYYDEDV